MKTANGIMSTELLSEELRKETALVELLCAAYAMLNLKTPDVVDMGYGFINERRHTQTAAEKATRDRLRAALVAIKGGDV